MKEISLTQGRVALVDDDDFERVNAHKWRASLESRGKKIYAKRRTKVSEMRDCRSHSIRMHHFVLNLVPCDLGGVLVVDHINGDSLDNRKENLRVITQRENMLASPRWNRKKEDPWL